MADTRDSLHKKRLAYLRTFCGPGETPHVHAEQVLKDLRKFCGMQKPGIVKAPNGMVDPNATMYLAGLRDAYLRIIGFLSIDEKHLYQENISESTQGKSAAATAER